MSIPGNKSRAVIFDMDGTLLDNNPYHLKAWQTFCKGHGIVMTEEEFKLLSGKSSTDTLQHLFGDQLTHEMTLAYKKEKEALYRDLVLPHIRPIDGLEALLTSLQKENIKMAIASSATPANLQFGLDKLGLAHYFETIVDSTQVHHGKPDPEIFLTAAQRLGAAPGSCVVFEDSLAGIRGAKAAGMKVVALTTTHPREELKEADQVINDYTEITTGQLYKIISPS